MATSAEKLKAYEQAFEKAQGFDSARFSQEFERDYGEATNYNKDLINQQSESLGRLQAVAPELRERYSNSGIKDPTLQRNLIAQARQVPITNWGQAVGLLDQRGMKYADILGKHLAGYESEAQRAQRAAENEWRSYQDLVSQEQFNRQLAKTGGGGGGSNLGALIAEIMGRGGQEQPKTDPRKALMSMIDEVAQLRKRKNIEGAQLDSYFRDIIQTAKDNNLNVNTEAVWQLLGNDIGKPMSLRLFY